MSDLISRKALITEIEMNMADICNADVREGMEFAIELINSIPTAFDKEKVIKELQKHSHNYYPSMDHYCTSVKAVKLRDVIDIIEKGR